MQLQQILGISLCRLYQVPSPEQLANYVKQVGISQRVSNDSTERRFSGVVSVPDRPAELEVVDQLQKLIKGAPRNIQEPGKICRDVFDG